MASSSTMLPTHEIPYSRCLVASRAKGEKLYEDFPPSFQSNTDVRVRISVNVDHHEALKYLPLKRKGELLGHFSLGDILSLPAVTEAVDKIGPIFKADGCRFIRNYMSFFVHKAAVMAERDREAGTLLILIFVSVVNVSSSALQAKEEAKGIAMPDSCSVCLEAFKFSEGEEIITTTYCHVFHDDCLREWWSRHKPLNSVLCPLCRCPLCRCLVKW